MSHQTAPTASRPGKIGYLHFEEAPTETRSAQGGSMSSRTSTPVEQLSVQGFGKPVSPLSGIQDPNMVENADSNHILLSPTGEVPQPLDQLDHDYATSSRASTPISALSIQVTEQLATSLISHDSSDTTQILDCSDISLETPANEGPSVTSFPLTPPLSGTELAAPSTQEPAERRLQADWMPYTLRWWYLGSLAIFTLSLLFALTALLAVSRRNDGVCADDGSNGVLFGWRFLPTILAVIYAQLTSMLFEDVRRTEPFALMARPTGALGSRTLLQRSDAWWTVLRKSLAKKDGKRSWALFFACLMHVLAFLLIAPLSSSVLTSMDVEIQKSVSFSSLVPKANAFVPLRSQGDVFFRTISNLVQNVTTSAWIQDEHIVFPTWPATIPKLPLGARLSENTQSWHTQSVVYQLDYDCRDARVIDVQYFARDSDTWTEPSVSVELRDGNGCSFIVDVEDHAYEWIFERGGAFWSNFHPSRNFPGKISFDDNAEQQCDSDVDVLFISTAWEKSNKRWDIGTNTTIAAQICTSGFHTAKIPLTIDSSQPGIRSRISFDEAFFKKERSLIPSTDLNISMSRGLLLDPSIFTRVVGLRPDQVKPDGGLDLIPQGITVLLSSFYNWNTSAMIYAGDIGKRAQQIQRRLFGEYVLASFEQSNASTTLAYPGTIGQNERRVLVMSQLTGVLLFLFGISIILLLFVWKMTRPSQRAIPVRQDPATVIGIGSLLPSLNPGLRLSQLSRASRKDIENHLRGVRCDLSLTSDHSKNTAPKCDYGFRNSARQFNWKPVSLRVWVLVSLIFYLATLQIAVLIMHYYSAQNKLYRTALVFQVPIQSVQAGTFAPYSILPTLLAVGVGLIWEVMDKIVRRLQPFLSMTRRPTHVRVGSGLSYQSSYLVWAATKALYKRHWVLSMVSSGSTICKILVISMSALFERRPGTLFNNITVTRLVEPRQIPHLSRLSNGTPAMAPNFVTYTETEVPGLILQRMFFTEQMSWMYSATSQLAFDSLEPPWSKDGWSFLPVEVPPLPDNANTSSIQSTGASESKSLQSSLATNLTVSTQAIRAYLECSPIPERDNASLWLKEILLGDYQKLPLQPNRTQKAFELTPNMFGSNFTSLFAHPGRIACCLNTSNDEYPQSVSLGYWSTTGNIQQWPNAMMPWPNNVTLKWLRGLAAPWPEYVNFTHSDQGAFGLVRSTFMFTEVPSLQALNCRPNIESVEAEVTIDYTSGTVQEFETFGKPKRDSPAWSDPLVERSWTENNTNEIFGLKDAEFTTSYGILFLGALLGASDLDQIQGPPRIFSKVPLEDTLFHARFGTYWSDSRSNSFKVEDNHTGTNMDLMTYSMYMLAEKEPEALLNQTTMLRLAQKTFSAYFQHFVSMNRDPNSNIGAYQRIGEKIEPALLNASRSLWDSKKNVTDWRPQFSYPELNTRRTANGTVSTRVEMLHMNAVATWVSVSSLAWLICTVIALLIMKKRYLGSLIRDIESIADVLVLIAGSDSLLKLIRETDPKELIENKEIYTKLGWFRGRDGQVRWGVEVVGDVGLGPVEWLDGPVGVVWEEEEKNEKGWWGKLKGWLRRSRKET